MFFCVFQVPAKSAHGAAERAQAHPNACYSERRQIYWSKREGGGAAPPPMKCRSKGNERAWEWQLRCRGTGEDGRAGWQGQRC